MKTSAFILLTTLCLTTTGAVVAQPANDNFGQAILITTHLVTGSNVGATRQPSDPIDVQSGSSRSPLGGRSVWWKWVAPDSRLYTFKTGDRSGQEPNSTFDTQLGVYTGATLGTLVEIGSNEDDVQYPTGLSSVVFNAVEGQTYHILVDGYAGSTGAIYLYVIPTRFTLSVSVNPPGSGTVNFDPEFVSSGYLAGTTVTLQAIPSTSTNFYAWSGSIAGRTNPITFVMNGNKTVVANFFDAPQIITGDAQIVLRNTDGRLAGWSFAGTEFLSNFSLGSTHADWRLAAVSDLNGNTFGDFLFQHRDGRISAWYMDENLRTNSTLIGTLPTSLRLAGAGDFNFDTKPDLVFQRTDGNLQVRFMNGANLEQSAGLGNVNPAWRAVTVADFNNDGSADIFFQHQDGRLAVWLMNGTTRTASLSLGTTQWRFATVRDLNNDGNPDLIFERDGRSAVWLMDGNVRASAVLFRDGAAIANSWRIIGTR
ncbi:MAG: VCBS repeat-containing protein [Verrucomicrobia bacterium]|nr:VCBS repeat-containing protein [Verrucomicrobiota bacterium]